METSDSGNLVIPPLRVAPPTDVDGYLVVARELLQALEPLSHAANVPPRASALIAAHCLECVLKAFLAYKGIAKRCAVTFSGTASCLYGACHARTDWPSRKMRLTG